MNLLAQVAMGLDLEKISLDENAFRWMLNEDAMATEKLAERLRPGHLVVLESTTYPGTTREDVLPMLATSGLEVGTDFFLAFSPERVDPGREDWTTKNTPKVLGGITEACTARAAELYGRALDELVPVSSPEAAELTKLLENIVPNM